MASIQSEYKIAVLLTCHNRKDKTVRAISDIKRACVFFNLNSSNHIYIEIFLTDDGCTDDTSEAARNIADDTPINIITADGNAFWAGGMRIAWTRAVGCSGCFDFYLLINDDTEFKENCFFELYDAHLYAINKYHKSGIYAGFISSHSDESSITYGAKVYKKSFFSKAVPLNPSGRPQECSMVNANFLLVSNDVVDEIGILDEEFIHAAADMDYGIRARKAGFPVLTTSNTCGYCEYDHDGSSAEKEKVMTMTLRDRKRFLDRPNIKQYHDSIEFYRRYDFVRWIIFRLSYYLNLYIPSVYYLLFRRRGH